MSQLLRNIQLFQLYHTIIETIIQIISCFVIAIIITIIGIVIFKKTNKNNKYETDTIDMISSVSFLIIALSLLLFSASNKSPFNFNNLTEVKEISNYSKIKTERYNHFKYVKHDDSNSTIYLTKNKSTPIKRIDIYSNPFLQKGPTVKQHYIKGKSYVLYKYQIPTKKLTVIQKKILHVEKDANRSLTIYYSIYWFK